LPKVFTAKRTNTIEANRILIEAKQQQKPAKLALSPALSTPPKNQRVIKRDIKMQQQQQLLHCRRKATNATATTTTARLVIFSSLHLLLLTTNFPPTVRADNGPAPQVAALAAPNPAGGVAGSSIIDQFSPNCSAVTHIFQARGIDAIEIPQKPSNGKCNIIIQMGITYIRTGVI